MSFARLRPIAAADITPLTKAAEEDGHQVFAATHVVEKDGQLIGYFSIGAIPTVLVWMDSKKSSAADSLIMNNSIDNFLRLQGVREMVVLCTDTSPFYAKMGKLGFAKVTNTSVFTKRL